MKILLAGGGSGGHFYPLIAVARALRKNAEAENIVKLDIFFMSDDPVDKDLIFKEDISFIKVPAGKMRRYFSVKYFPDTIKTLVGIIWAFWRVYLLLPDAIFAKGGYASFPVLFAARILRIPVLIHSSDSVPGLVERWAGKWARRIAISFPEAAKFFEGKNAALIGNPVRQEIVGGNFAEAVERFGLEEGLTTLLIMGGSQGAEHINETILAVLPEALKRYQIIHQTGKNNFGDVSGRAKVILEHSEFKARYHPQGFFEEGDLRNASRAANLVVSRAAAGAIFEIAAWGLSSILIPLPSAAQNHQRENAYAYARAGACEVLEETNLTPHLLLQQIDKILSDPTRMDSMRKSAQNFAKPDAADKIAKELIKLAIHE